MAQLHRHRRLDLGRQRLAQEVCDHPLLGADVHLDIFVLSTLRERHRNRVQNLVAQRIELHRNGHSQVRKRRRRKLLHQRLDRRRLDSGMTGTGCQNQGRKGGKPEDVSSHGGKNSPEPSRLATPCGSGTLNGKGKMPQFLIQLRQLDGLGKHEVSAGLGAEIGVLRHHLPRQHHDAKTSVSGKSPQRAH